MGCISYDSPPYYIIYRELFRDHWKDVSFHSFHEAIAQRKEVFINFGLSHEQKEYLFSLFKY